MSTEKHKLSLIEQHEVLLKLLVEFDQFCVENNLRYYLAGGTLLGAVRHGGFIPWDDDVDVVMPRPDYEKLIKENYIAEDAQVISSENSQGHYHPIPYCNIVDTSTIIVENNIKRSTNKGLFIDVFPLDGLPDDSRKRKKHLSKLLRLESLLLISINKNSSSRGIKGVAKKLISIIMSLFDETKLAKKITSIAKRYNYENCNEFVCAVFLQNKPERFITPKLDYSSCVLLDFEKCKLCCPIGYKNVLRRSFGDYMQLPPENERYGQHGIDVYKID